MHPSGCSNIFTLNVLGHAVLLEALAERHCIPIRTVFAGTEMSLGQAFPNATADAIEQLMTETGGSASKMYGMSKALGTLYISAFARKHAAMTWTVSPGGTHSTGAFDDLPLCLRCIVNFICLPIRYCVCHSPSEGAQRYVMALTQENYPYSSGGFVASRSGAKGMTADMLETKKGACYANEVLQDATYAAIRRYIMK